MAPMSRPGPPSTTDALPAWQAISLSLLLVLAGNGLLLIFDAPGVLEDGLPTRFWDPDSYARLLRVEQWLRDEGWYATPLRSLNAPYGLVMHWTLPLDLLIAALAVPLRPLFGGAQALHTAGMLVGPLLAWSALALLLKHGSRLVGRRAALFAALLLAVQPATGSRFALGQADHHHLMMVLHLFVLLAVARAACDGHARRWSLAAGVAAGLMLWVSPPALVTLTAAALALGLLWACGWLAVAPLTRFAAGLAATVAAALALERPPAQWVVLEYDRLSAAHLWLALALLAAAGCGGSSETVTRTVTTDSLPGTATTPTGSAPTTLTAPPLTSLR